MTKNQLVATLTIAASFLLNACSASPVRTALAPVAVSKRQRRSRSVTLPLPPPFLRRKCSPVASYYGYTHRGPNRTANGEYFRPWLLTAASRTLPFGTMVHVENLINHKSITVRINDRGPFGSHCRVLDLTTAAARRIDAIHRGVIPISMQIVGFAHPRHLRRK